MAEETVPGGIYILQTFGPEYRVAYSENIDTIYGPLDDTGQWTGNNTNLIQQFGKAAMFTDMEKAFDKASEMSYDHEYLEDGISLITDFKERRFDSF